jgi:hypothetical protein
MNDCEGQLPVVSCPLTRGSGRGGVRRAVIATDMGTGGAGSPLKSPYVALSRDIIRGGVISSKLQARKLQGSSKPQPPIGDVRSLITRGSLQFAWRGGPPFPTFGASKPLSGTLPYACVRLRTLIFGAGQANGESQISLVHAYACPRSAAERSKRRQAREPACTALYCLSGGGVEGMEV